MLISWIVEEMGEAVGSALSEGGKWSCIVTSDVILPSLVEGLDRGAGGLAQGPVGRRMKGCPQDKATEHSQICGGARGGGSSRAARPLF